jgi:hypothetical protein
LSFQVKGLYTLLASTGIYEVQPVSKDLSFGSFNWSKYRSLKIVVHRTDSVSFYLSCSNCPVESSPEGFASMAAFLGGVRKELLKVVQSLNLILNEDSLPEVDDWIVKKWHFGRDSAQEFAGERFNLTFKMWCGILARIYIHHQDRTQKIRMEIIQAPNKPLRQVVAEKLNLCCSRCAGCSKQS